MRSLSNIASSNEALLDAAVCQDAVPPAEATAQASFQEVLDLIDFGVVLLKSTGEVTFANRMALSECRAGGAIRLSGGRLEVRDAECRTAFPRAVQAAQRGLRSMLNLKGVVGTRSVVVAPLAGVIIEGGNCRPQILVMLGRPYDGCSLTMEMFARSYNLTVAETGVLRGLYQGETPREVARTLNVAICTVRTHIENIRRKTGDPNIRELLKQVQGVPPLAPTQTAYPTLVSPSKL